MAKRILWMFLAALTLVSCIPVPGSAAQTRPSPQYCVSLISDLEGNSVSVGDTVTVRVMVSGKDASVKAYNAYDLKLSYDREYLTLVSRKKADTNAEITAEENRIRVKGYGADKDFSIPAVTLSFEVKKTGKADISLLHAKVDFSDNAGLLDAPEVPIGKNADTVTVSTSSFAVQVEGAGIQLPGNANVAEPKKDFVFQLEDHKYYDYEVHVTINGVDMTAGLIYNRTKGTYTIPHKDKKGNSLIDGDIKITATRTPKSFSVNLTGKDVAGEKKAYYHTDYTFALLREEGYLYTVEITINKEKYTGYHLEGNYSTIPGTDITGNIRVTVTRREDDSDKVYVDFAGTGARDGSGQKKTVMGVEYPFKIKKKTGYTYSLAVYVEGKRVPYEYGYEADTYYIPPEHVSGNIVVVIGKIPTIEASEYIMLDRQNMYLILYNGTVPEEQVPKYDGQSMYWSDRYRAYAWLVESKESVNKVKKTAEGMITISEGTAAGSIDYSGNVNMTLRTDSGDAELVWEMYEGKYSLDFMEMQKLLRADVHSDRKVNVRDVAAIVSSIS